MKKSILFVYLLKMFEISGILTKIYPTKTIDRFFKVTIFEITFLTKGKKSKEVVRTIEGHKDVQKALEGGEFREGELVVVTGALKGRRRKSDNSIINYDEAYGIKRA